MESSRLKMEIGQRNELLYKIDAETQMVEKVISQLVWKNNYTFYLVHHELYELNLKFSLLRKKEIWRNCEDWRCTIHDNEAQMGCYYGWLPLTKIKKITLLGLNQFVLTSSLHSNHFHWAGEQRKTKEWDFFSVLLLLWLWTIFAWAKHQKYPIPCSPTPQKCLLHRLISWFLWVTRHYVWPPYMLHQLYLLLCTNKLFLTFLLR